MLNYAFLHKTRQSEKKNNKNVKLKSSLSQKWFSEIKYLKNRRFSKMKKENKKLKQKTQHFNQKHTKEILVAIEINLENSQEKMLLESIKRLKNPFVNISVQDVAKDLRIGENMAYAIFKRDDFPSINIGRCWKICLISYIMWKTQKRV